MDRGTNAKSKMKSGRIKEWRQLSSNLAAFQLVAEDGGGFPSYEAGQYIALRRDDCLLTKKLNEGGEIRYVPDIGQDGEQKRGPVTHSYSIASSPYESAEGNLLEFYVVLDQQAQGPPGRFTESLFRVQNGGDDRLDYFDRIVGDFTLAKRAAGFEHVLMVATGTGLAPFRSMIKQLHFEAKRNAAPQMRFTLMHTNRTYQELGYHSELLEIEDSKSFDFVYVPSVSRPSSRDRDDPALGAGRANNLLRKIFALPARESTAVPPELPRTRPLEMLRERIDPVHTVVLSCGNPDGMSDIAWVAEQTGMRFEKEDW